MEPQEPPPGGAPPRSIEAVFEVLREGVALCEVVRDENGAVVDYWIRYANSAFLRGLGGRSALGKNMRQLRPDISQRWYDMWHHILDAGHPTRFEYHDRNAGRWYDVDCTPLSKDEVVQLYVEVTHRKKVEAHLAHLLNELNHRVKNNLMMVTSMLAMQARGSTQPEVKHELQQAIDRIQSIAEVHTILYKSGAVETVRFDSYLSDLCERLAAMTPDQRIAIEVDAQPLEVASDEAVQLGIVVNELITNALKHAYPAPAQGKIIVRLRPAGDAVLLGVQDFGAGLPTHKAVNGNGIGMRLVRSLVQKHGGTVDIQSDHGTDVRVTLPYDRTPESSGRAARLL